MFKKILLTLALVFSISMPTGAAQMPNGSEPPPTPAPAPAPRAACPRGLGILASCPIRIRFGAGAYGAMLNGALTRSPDVRYYVIHARAGQKMYLAFLGRGHLRGGITYPNGSGDGPFVSGQTVLDLPQTGDYIIYLGQHTMADEAWTGRFTLSVMVQ